MENVWKKAGALMGNLFTSNPQITEKDRADLQAAMDDDAANALANQTAKVGEMERDLATARSDKEAAETALATASEQLKVNSEKLAAVTADLDSARSDNATLQAKVNEYEPIKAQLDAYRLQIGGAQPEGSAGADTSGKTARELEIERLKAENPISMAFYKGK